MSTEDNKSTICNNNTLYPQPGDKLCALLSKYIKQGSKVQLGDYFDITNKRTFPVLIKKCIKIYFRRRCNGCTGSHQYVIAGGYASYLAGLTTRFNDINIYIDCTKLLEQDTLSFTNYQLNTSGIVSNVIYNNRPKIQLTQITFNIGIYDNMKMTHTFRSIMAMYVIDRFDLPICRVAAFVPLNRDDLKLAYIINASTFQIFKTPTSLARKLKYEDRKTKNTKLNPPNLQLTILFNLMNELSKN